MLFNLLQTAADTIAAAGGLNAGEVQVKTLNLIDMAMAGGWLMIVLLILSVVAIYISATMVADTQGRKHRQELHEGYP